MRIVRARPHEFLVVGRRGRLRSLGVGGSVFVGPGRTAVTVPADKHEVPFGMTQESRDGIPLRFKGTAVVRVVDPVAAATAFDFSGRRGLEQMGEILAHLCLGELREAVSHLSMSECVESRKTTLTDAVSTALRRAVHGDGGGEHSSWGIAVELVQVAQVYVVDDGLRAKLEAASRHEIAARGEQAGIEAGERLARARLASGRRLEEEELESARESSRVAREKHALEHELALERARDNAILEGADEQARVRAEEQVALARQSSAQRVAAAKLDAAREAHRADVERVGMEQALRLERAERDAAVRRRELEIAHETADLGLSVARETRDVRAVEAETEVLLERARAEVEARLLPLRQVPEVARALSQALQGADLSIYGADHALAAAVGPLLDRLARVLAVDGPNDTVGAKGTPR